MSDFKLGIVRLGRVAGKVSWIPGLPCAAGGGPAGKRKVTRKDIVSDAQSALANRVDYYEAVANAGVVRLYRFKGV